MGGVLMTTWTHRLYIIIPATEQATANAYAAQLDPDPGGALTFGEATLSANGSAPARSELGSSVHRAALSPLL